MLPATDVDKACEDAVCFLSSMNRLTLTLIALALFLLLGNRIMAATFGDFAYTDDGTSITITDYPTTAIGDVVIPGTIDGKPVTVIGSSAFYRCSGLTTITIPSSVTSIGSSAFYGCSGLTSITIPSSVISIGSSAFLGCSAMTSIDVDLATANYSSSNGALYDKLQTTLIQCPGGFNGSFVIPTTATSIESNAFRSCGGLTSITIPSSVTSIGSSAFHGCSGLTSITIPSSVTSIESSAFYGCSAMTSIDVDPANANYSSLNGVLYDNLQTNLIVCPNGKSGVFMIPDGVVQIENYAFSYCDKLSEILLPDTVTTIGSSWIIGCSSLSTLTLPESVASIGMNFVYGCPQLDNVIFLGDAPRMSGSQRDSSAVFYVFSDRLRFTLPTWNGFTVIEMGITDPIKPWLVKNDYNFDTDINTDSDGDGVSLLEAYALDLNPRNARAEMPVVELSASTMDYEFYSSAEGISYTIETSNDLSTWVTTGITLSPIGADGKRTASVPLDVDRRFIRLRVEQN
ncbi:MAG: leucine-rich repeat domain-containing protein [Luteolibacter sp.]